MIKKKDIISFVLPVLAICLAMEANSQKLPFRTYSIEQGLSESVVYDLHQGRDGYLWIGTGYGLNRFDGSEMQTFYQHHGLNGNQINKIVEDETGRLWIGTDAGVNIYERDSIHSPENLKDLKPYVITAIYEDQSGHWWFGSDGAGIWYLDANDELTQYLTVHGLAGDRVTDILQGQNGVLWFATTEGLTNLYDGNFTTFTASNGLPDNHLHTLEAGGDGRIWIGGDGGLTILEEDEFTTYHTAHGLAHNSVLSISLKGNAEAWLGTEQGAARFDGGSFRNYTTAQGLSSNIVFSTMIDREGNIWFGTMGGGANIYLGEYFHNYTEDEGLSNNVVTGFDEDAQGEIWMATFNGGVMHFDGSGFTRFDESDGLADNRVFTVYHDNERPGRVLAGTRSGISIIEDSQVHPPAGHFAKPEGVRTIFQDLDTGDFWVGTENDGVYHISGESVQIYDDTNGLNNNTVMWIGKDSGGRMWFATYGGVALLEDDRIRNFTTEDGLPSNGVTHILFDHQERVWVSTFNGFARLDVEQGRTEIFESGFGHSTTLAYFMYQDSDNEYWAGTNTGIVQFDYERYQNATTNIERELAYRLVNREQGLVANEMNVGAVHKDASGSIWLGTVEGISRFYPERYPVRTVPPQVHFKEIIVAGEAVDPTERIHMSHERNFVQFELTGISFAAPSQVLFEYRLDGVDEVWTHSYDRTMRYPSLSPGEYSFQLRAYNTSGIHSESASSFDFEIRPPVWLRWWFTVLVVLVVLAVILLIYNYFRVSRQVDMERMRVQIASDLHDDVGASLTELALQTDFLRTGKLEESVETTLKQIGEHSRKIVSTLDDIVWSIDARNDTAGDLTDRMQDHANRLLSQKGIGLNFNFSALDTGRQLPVQVKENLYLIFKESVNNIAKHSDADKVDITLSIQGKKYLLDVADNGTVATNGRKTGHGLRNINMRAKRIDANAIIKRERGFNVKVEGLLR